MVNDGLFKKSKYWPGVAPFLPIEKKGRLLLVCAGRYFILTIIKRSGTPVNSPKTGLAQSRKAAK